jgi:cobalamin transport system substrate-binding protein
MSVRLALVAVVLAAACTRAHVVAPATAARVVSLSPSTTEALFAIGAGGAVVGRSRYCDWPPEALRLPQVGGYVDASFEAVLALRPDLVTGARGPAGPDLVGKLEARSIATFFPVTESFAGIDAMIEGLGSRTGHATEARALVESLHEREARVQGAVADLPRVPALLVFGVAPIVAAGPESFADEVLRRAGATNVATGGAYPTLSFEHVLALDPDVILDAAVAEEHGGERISPAAAGWSAVRAVREGRVVALADERVLRPGPRIAEGLAIVAHALHPQAAIPVQ